MKFPKPTPRPKKAPARLKRRRRLRARGETAYRDRDRETGRMLFVARGRVLRCAARGLPGAGRCRGRPTAAHLGDRRTNGGYRKCPDDEIGCLCWGHHEDVDNRLVWSSTGAGFYLSMAPEARVAFRVEAIRVARVAWEALSAADRARWDSLAPAGALR